MANMDLLSYERDSRWMPHLSWTFPDWTLQEKMAQQAVQREQAWQRIADKLGPLLIGPDVMSKGGGSSGSLGQSDYIVRDIEDQDYQERAYEKAPLLTANIKPQKNHAKFDSHHKSRNGYQSLSHNNQQSTHPKYIESFDSLRPSQSPVFSEKRSQSSGFDVNFIEQQQQNKQPQNQSPNQVQRQYDCESFKKAKRRCWTVSGILISLVLFLITLVILMALGVIQYKTFPKVPL